MDKHDWANSADPDQTAPRGAVLMRVLAAFQSICIIQRHDTTAEPLRMNPRVFTVKLTGVRNVRNFTVSMCEALLYSILASHLNFRQLSYVEGHESRFWCYKHTPL